MQGLIVYNGFWNRSKPPSSVSALVNAAQKQGVTLRPVANTEMAAVLGGNVRLHGDADAPFALFWDKDVRLARAMEATGMRLYNTADAVAVCDDKAATHLALCKAHIPMPETWVAPMAYVDYDAEGDAFLCAAENALGYPLVVKECFGSLGGQVYLANNGQELRALARGMHARPFLLQKWIAASCGTDKRLYVVGDTVVAAMTRHNDRDFRANVGAGGHGEAYTPTERETALALLSARTLGAEIAGVDLLHDKDGLPLVCEVNSAGQTAELTACTGVDVNAAILRYVIGRERERT